MPGLLQFREGIPLKDAGGIHMVNDRSVRQVLPLKGEILVLVTAGHVSFQIRNLHLLDKYIPHLVVRTLIKNLSDHLVLFHKNALPPDRYLTDTIIQYPTTGYKGGGGIKFDIKFC